MLHRIARQSPLAALVTMLVFAFIGAAALAQDPQEAVATQNDTDERSDNSVQLVGLEISPANGRDVLAADTLCTLSVLLSNTSDRSVFSLAFEVSIGGTTLPVYEKQLFMVPVPPDVAGKPFKLDLFNFWTSDSQRPAPADGKLGVEVRLLEAQWLAISEEEEALPGSSQGQAPATRTVEVWTPQGAVNGLPSTQTKTLVLASSPD